MYQTLKPEGTQVKAYRVSAVIGHDAGAVIFSLGMFTVMRPFNKNALLAISTYWVSFRKHLSTSLIAVDAKRHPPGARTHGAATLTYLDTCLNTGHTCPQLHSPANTTTRDSCNAR